MRIIHTEETVKHYKVLRVERDIWLRLQMLKYKMVGEKKEPVSLSGVIESLLDAHAGPRKRAKKPKGDKTNKREAE